MADTRADIAAFISDSGETASSALMYSVQRRCLDLIRASEADTVLLFAVAMIAGSAAERIESGNGLADEDAEGWRTVSRHLADALASGSTATVRTAIQLLYPPVRSH